MKVFVDNNLPPALARGLHALFEPNHQVICHRDKFPNSHRLDEEWIPALGSEGGWVVLSGDRNIAKKRPQRELFMRAQLVGFFPRSGVMDLPLHRKAARILMVWPDMENLARLSRPALFELPQSGSTFRQLRG